MDVLIVVNLGGLVQSGSIWCLEPISCRDAEKHFLVKSSCSHPYQIFPSPAVMHPKKAKTDIEKSTLTAHPSQAKPGYLPPMPHESRPER